ncbi:hypothetical protein PG994_001418 [Apiospora phragmitis]|uniref:RanBP2-type domain-containing protein n=1 Tax=Apiospora phragmitis TaxID=2905665 RepID=A0ABR1WTH8_9PEZI
MDAAQREVLFDAVGDMLADPQPRRPSGLSNAEPERRQGQAQRRSRRDQKEDTAHGQSRRDPAAVREEYGPGEGYTLTDPNVRCIFLQKTETRRSDVAPMSSAPQCPTSRRQPQDQAPLHWIHRKPRSIPRSNLWCWNCEAETCLTCRQAGHDGACDEDLLKRYQEADEKLLQLAEEKGWRKRPVLLRR